MKRVDALLVIDSCELHQDAVLIDADYLANAASEHATADALH